jgi:hypothetical protein
VPHDDLGFVPYVSQNDLGFVPEQSLEDESSFGEETLRQLGRTGRGVATGIAGLADIPNLAAMGLHAAGLKEDPLFYEPVAQRVQEKIDEIIKNESKRQIVFDQFLLYSWNHLILLKY